jgi:hypothetical protein
MMRRTTRIDLATIAVLLTVAAGWFVVDGVHRPRNAWLVDSIQTEVGLTYLPYGTMSDLVRPAATGRPAEPTAGLVLRRMGIFGPLLAVCALLLLCGLAVTVLRLRRGGGSGTARFRRLALRAGLLALTLGIAGSALGEANDLLVLDRLGYVRDGLWTDADRTSTPWGSLALSWTGLLLATIGGLESAALALARRRRGGPSSGDRP